MYGYVYKVTNIVNNKIYIGQHCSSTFDESYYGSGSYFIRALNKYGKENFKREIIEQCDDFETLNNREEYWIQYYLDLGYVFGKSIYNLKKTAIGGDTYTFVPEEHRAQHKMRLSKTITGRSQLEETRKKISESNRGKKKSENQITKMIISEKASKKHWYTNGIDNKLISEGDPIPDNYYAGRTSSDELKAYIKEKTIEGNKKHNKVVWNKGRTKYTDTRIAQYGMTQHQNSLKNK